MRCRMLCGAHRNGIVIRFEQVSKRYPAGGAALEGVSFALEPAEMAFVTGHSGAGKSTLLKLIGLLERPSSGAVTVAGRNLRQTRGQAIARHRRAVGMVFQDHRVLLDRTVQANVELPLVVAGVPGPERARRARAALDKVGLGGMEQRLPSRLSTGEQQRVGIARAIVARPPVLLADEPTGNLDPQLAVEIMQLFAEFQAIGTTVVVATHDLLLIKRIRKRVLVLDHGRLVDDVPAGEVAA